MVKLQKILCFLFTLFIVYMVSQQCNIEGLQVSAFDNCIDDPKWFTQDKDGNKFKCSDIGTSASCYDINNATGQEGWERCLKTCGNCSEGKVTNSQQDNLAFYSGDPVQDYGMVLFTDDERKWVGLDVGDGDKKDVRGSIMSDQAESIMDIYDRLKPMEGLYDMLLGSVSSCLNCEQYTMSECTNHSDKCVVTNGVCGPKVPTGSPTKFTSCNGSELSCDYKVAQPVTKSSTTSSTSSSTTSSSSTKPAATKQVSGENVKHTYIKHQCDNNGDCSLMFPTVEFNCNQLPKPQAVSGSLPEIVYAPAELSTRKCIKKDYLTTPDSNIVASNDKSRQCLTTPSTTTLTIPITGTTTTDISIPSANQSNFPWTAATFDPTTNAVTTPGTSVTITPITGTGAPADPTVCNLPNPNSIMVESIDGQSPNKTFKLKDTKAGVTIDISSLAKNCQVTNVPAQPTAIPNCIQLTPNEVKDSNGNDISRRSCGSVCNSIDDTVQYISVDGNKCYCYKEIPKGNNSFETPQVKNSQGNPVNECPSKATGNLPASLEILDEGRSLQMSSIPMVGVNADQQMRDMCKSYFLVEKSLTGQDVQNMKSVKKTGTSGSSSSTRNIDGMSERISLYDVCPRQCKAQGCPAPVVAAPSSTTGATTTGATTTTGAS